MITLVTLKCDFCSKSFTKSLGEHNQCIKRGRKNHFCSIKCVGAFKNLHQSCIIDCQWCGKSFSRALADTVNKNNFCTQSCFGKYHNAHKTYGYRRSKLEAFLELRLKEIYPNLDIIYNNHTEINSELDIYIPSLNLAFELNGIFHYEPIYGEEKLKSIQNNDGRKFQACLEKRIELCIIDTSKQRKFTEKSSLQYLDIVRLIIALKLAVTGNDPVTNSL